MSLNNINTSPTYYLTVPSSNKKIKFRPYNVAEQKKLLLAHIEEDNEAIMLALKEMVESCTFGSVEFSSSPSFDIEYILVKLRAKSAGEIVDVGIKCISCDKLTPVQINLDQVKLEGEADKNIKLNDDLYQIMKYPTVEASVSFDPEDLDSVFSKIADCVDTVVYGEEVYDSKDQKKSDIVSFLGKLTEQQLEKVKVFFDCIPKLTYRNKHVCVNCGHENQVFVTGVTNFFI